MPRAAICCSICGSIARYGVTPVRVGGHQAEAAVRAARVDGAADVEPFEQGRRRATGHVAHCDLDRFAGAHCVIVDRRERVTALGRGAVGVMEMDLEELPGN